MLFRDILIYNLGYSIISMATRILKIRNVRDAHPLTDPVVF